MENEQPEQKKSAREIFDEIPFPLKIVVLVGSLFIVFVIFYILYLVTMFEPPQRQPRIASITNARESGGVFDPSVASDGTMKVMAHTIVYEFDGRMNVEVMLTQGLYNCLSWEALGGKIEQRQDRLIGPDFETPVADGFWRAETPSIVYDPADTGREWKLFAYRYFWGGNTALARLYGVIVMRYASNPAVQEWSKEEWMFSASDGTPPEPYAGLITTKINTLHKDLEDVYFYARPSVVNVDNVLVMSLSAFIQGKETPDRVILLASTDHARSWRYLGTALRASDIKDIGAEFTSLNGASLFMKDRVMYMAATLGTVYSDGTGAHVFEFENASAARLRRDAKTGKITATNFLPTQQQPATRAGGGSLAYTDACPRMTFMSESLTNRRQDIYVHQVPPVK
ncbi:MAG: hypothetical protein RBS08_00870 [Bdellovibrionales bacterium]|jgi:hypothetical protein|nr:hypothetical protein [Bdellovibrionales bacterium]